jgi:hypothetical protein
VGGWDNSAFGFTALNDNTSGNYNTAAGDAALYHNTTGNNDTASGYEALYSNTSGIQNTAVGMTALYSNTTAHYNTAVGVAALYKSTSGNSNIALGWEAGYDLTTGSNNIDIGNPGAAADGASTDSGVIRIGTTLPTQLQTTTYIAGIYGVKTATTGTAVVIDSSRVRSRFSTGLLPRKWPTCIRSCS